MRQARGRWHRVLHCVHLRMSSVTEIPIPGYERYTVDEMGVVRSYVRPMHPLVLKQSLTSTRYFGYPTVCLYAVGKASAVAVPVHRCVLLAHTGPCPVGGVTRHLDGDPTNNQLSNLAWGTKSENALDMRAHGVDPQVNKTHCPAGHAYDEKNTINRRGNRRGCRQCGQDAQRRYYQRKKAGR